MMKHKNKWLLGMVTALTAAVLVTGCSLGKKSTSMESGDASGGSVVMMVGDQQVRRSEVLAYSYFLKCQYEDSFGKELWSYRISENETIGDQAKQEIVNMITQLKIISAVAEEQGVSLSMDEQDEALQQAESLVRNASAEDKEAYALTVQEISQVYQENALANKMFYVATDDADINVSDEEARQAVLESMQEEAGSGSGAAGNDGANSEESENGSDEAGNTGADSEESESSSDAADNAGDSTADREISEDAISQAKEQIIQERQSEMFIKKYNQWLQDKTVDINQNFWNEFSL